MARRANGDAKPYLNQATGRWEVFIELPSPDGKRRRKKVSGPTVSECREKARQVRAELDRFGEVVNSVTTVAQLLDAWLATLPGTVADTTLETYERSTRLYVRPDLGRKRVARLQPRDVSAWLAELEGRGLSAATRKQARAILRKALAWGEHEGIVTRNVAAVTPGPRGQSSHPDPLTPDQARDLLAGVRGWRFESAVSLMLLLGLRRGETFGLMWGDLDLDDEPPTLTIRRQLQRLNSKGHVLTATKTAKSARRIALPSRLVDLLAEHRAAMDEERARLGAKPAGPKDLVFTTELGTPVDMRNFARDLGRLAVDSGVHGVHPHRLRHSTAALLLDQGIPLDAVSETLGHSSIRTTKDVYGKMLDPGRARVAAAIERALEPVKEESA
jgi:integrase